MTLLKLAESQRPRFRKCFPMPALWDSLGAGRELCSCWQQFRPGSSLVSRACAKICYVKAASSSYSHSERLGDVDLCLLQTWHQWDPQEIPQRHAYMRMPTRHEVSAFCVEVSGCPQRLILFMEYHTAPRNLVSISWMGTVTSITYQCRSTEYKKGVDFCHVCLEFTALIYFFNIETFLLLWDLWIYSCFIQHRAK